MSSRAPSSGPAAFAAAPLEILRVANQGMPLAEFLRTAARVLLGFSEADVLDLWFDHAEHLYHYRATRHVGTSWVFEVLPAGEACLLEEGGLEPGPQAEVVLKRILRLIPDGAQFRAEAARSPGGTVWSNGLGDELPSNDNCADNRGADQHTHRAVALVPFVVAECAVGALRLTSRKPEFFTSERIESCEWVAHLFGVSLVSYRATAALAERVKELTCMYRMAQVAGRAELELDAALQEIVEVLPPGWQFPEQTTAQIVLGGRVFRSPGFQEAPHSLSADILVRGALCGRVEVFRRVARSDEPLRSADREPPFLTEEQHLIDAVAHAVAAILERTQAEEEKGRLRDQVHHVERLATIGQLAAGVAHELNEPLSNILGFAQLANKCTAMPEEPRRDIDRIVTASLYAREVIKKLMLFARRAPHENSDVDLTTVVEAALSLVERRCAKEGIQLQRDLAVELPEVFGDPAQLQQVVVNVAVNAIQAMPSGGTLVVRTAAHENTVSLVVEDTGEGIAEKDLEHVFEPFFTTKGIGQGTGLGLAVAHGIISAHGGTARIESEAGRGTCFTAELPRSTERADRHGEEGE